MHLHNVLLVSAVRPPSPRLSTWQVGDSVAAVLWTGGGFAEEVVAPASNVLRLPGAPPAAGTSIPETAEHLHNTRPAQRTGIAGAASAAKTLAVMLQHTAREQLCHDV